MLNITIEDQRLEGTAELDLLTVTYKIDLSNAQSSVLHCWVRGPYTEWMTAIGFYDYFHAKRFRTGDTHGVVTVDKLGRPSDRWMSSTAELRYSYHEMIIPVRDEEHARELIMRDLQNRRSERSLVRKRGVTNE